MSAAPGPDRADRWWDGSVLVAVVVVAVLAALAVLAVWSFTAAFHP